MMHKCCVWSLLLAVACEAQTSLAFDRAQQAMPARGGDVTVGVVAPAGVAWSISTLGTFVVVKSGTPGAGNGSVTLTIPPNPNSTARAGNIAVTPAGPGSGYLPGFLLIQQAAANAAVTLNPAAFDAVPEGATGSITIVSSGEWVAGTAVDWIQLSAPGYGTGSGTLSFLVLYNNTGRKREGTITINGQAFIVTQEAVTAPFTLTPTVIDVDAAGGSGVVDIVTRTAGLSWTVYPSVPWLYFSQTGAGNGAAGYFVSANPSPFPRTGNLAVTHDFLLNAYVTVRQRGATKPLQFVPVSPCRLWDTRPLRDQFDNPHFTVEQQYSVTDGPCGIPAQAQAYSLNVTVIPRGTALGFLTIWPDGTDRPLVSTLNAIDGRIKANAAIVPAGAGGRVRLFATNETDVVLDINGYFVDPVGAPQSLAFYPLPPCRVLDTRYANGPLGGPAIPAAGVRDVPVLSSNCGVPASAQAYSLNATVAPLGPLSYLTLWPTGQAQPFVSTLNAVTGAIVANAAIVPAGTSGSISAFATSQTHLVLDINGYFAPPGSANAQRYYAVGPCRLLDTRQAAGEFGGPVLTAGQSRGFRLPLAACGLPTTAAAYALNATVVPETTLSFLTLWPSGAPQPLVSTLNALDDLIVANAAIVPAGTAGAVSSYVTNGTHLILDANGYFAP